MWDNVSTTPVLVKDNGDVERPHSRAKLLGQILLEGGQLTEIDIERIVDLQPSLKLNFGETALRLGLINEQELVRALAQQFNYHYLSASAATTNGPNPKELVAAFNPFGAKAEAFRALRAQLTLPCSEYRRKAIAVISPAHGDGRSYVAANLAVVFSQLEAKTILVDADFDNPRQHEIFGRSNATGLSNILAGHRDWSEMGDVPVFPNLSVLPSGPVPPNRQELLENKRFLTLLDGLENRFEFVIIDTPPVRESTTAQTTALMAGAALVLARKDRCRARDLVAIREMVGRPGCHILGAVLNQR